MKKLLCPMAILSILFAAIFGKSTYAEVRLPRLVSNGMVLQRDTRVRIWGWAAPGEEVTINFNQAKYQTRADGEGQWKILLSSGRAGGPYTMKIDASNHLEVTDILVGEVWVCSGQSNMVLPMERVKYRYADDIARSANPLIRQFFVPNEYDFEKIRKDLSSGKWEQADPQSVLHFSAAAYFFARALFDRYQVPVGLINTAVGGPPADAWLSEEALQAFPASLATALKYKNPGYLDSISRHDMEASRAWYATLWQKDQGLHESIKWYDTAYDATSWNRMHVPGLWATENGKPVNGVMWFRKEVEVPPGMTGKPVRLLLGRIIDRDSVFVNGIFSGTIGYQYPPRIYELPAGLLRAGKNIIVVRIINSAGRGGFVTGKPYLLKTGNDSISLEGDWQYRLGAKTGPLAPSTFFQYQPLGLFNGMIAPISCYTIKGVIWYQGEGDLSHASQYEAHFKALISDWRRVWGQGDFPFLYVQLANYQEGQAPSPESSWPVLRESQRKTLAVRNTGMVVAMDIGEWNDIHPLNKKAVGQRLALQAMHLAYGDTSIVYCGPLYSSMKREGRRIVLNFTQEGKGLVARGDSLYGFTIAGPDKKFIVAKATIEGDRVEVWNDRIADPVAVRYAWADNPELANLYNKEGLPASPFSTDD